MIARGIAGGRRTQIGRRLTGRSGICSVIVIAGGTRIARIGTVMVGIWVISIPINRGLIVQVSAGGTSPAYRQPFCIQHLVLSRRAIKLSK